MAIRSLLFALCAMVATLTAVDARAAGSEIADAAMRGDADALRALLARGADVNAAQGDGATALHWAAYRDDTALAAVLLAAGANLGAANRTGVTALHLACLNGSIAMIEALLKAGADPNVRLPNGETPLMMAARTGRALALAVLVDHGADVNAKEALRGTTALMWAAAEGHPAAVQLLIERGADVNARSNPDHGGMQVFHARAEDPRPSRKPGGRASPANPRMKPASDRSGGGFTPLVFAVRRNDHESVRLLVAGGADVNQVTNYGWSPLLVAAHNRYYLLGRFLLELGADPNLANKGGWTPLYLTVDNRNIEGGDYPVRKGDMDHLDFIKLLLERGADVNARMIDTTPLRTVFTSQWVLEDGATAFWRASMSSDLAVMRLLLDYGADPTIPTRLNVTALQVAAGIGWLEGITYEWSATANLEAVKLLLDLGIDPNGQAETGRTALHGAAHKGRPAVIQILVDYGARLETRDYGMTANDLGGRLFDHTWQAVDYADGLVRVGAQSALFQPEAAALLRKLMAERGLRVPPNGRTRETVCLVPYGHDEPVEDCAVAGVAGR